MDALDGRLKERLPPAVYDLAIRLGARPDRDPTMAWLSQTGRMRQDAASRWMSFKAQQTIRIHRCGFDWRARIGPGGLVSVRDTLSGGTGALHVKALGFIPIAHARGSLNLTRGEIMRYLAELAWSPDAILHNAELRWREAGPETLVVGAGVGDASVEVTLNLNSEGRIGGAFAPDRPRAVGALFIPTPWRGSFSGYCHHNDVWLPFAGQVAWIINGEDLICWEGRLKHWEVTGCGN